MADYDRELYQAVMEHCKGCEVKVQLDTEIKRIDNVLIALKGELNDLHRALQGAQFWLITTLATLIFTGIGFVAVQVLLRLHMITLS